MAKSSLLLSFLRLKGLAMGMRDQGWKFYLLLPNPQPPLPLIPTPFQSLK